MNEEWQYQVRIDLPDELAVVARQNPGDPALGQLPAILDKHRVSLKCQFDAFAEYVAEAERHGVENYPLYEWTKTTIENPAKKPRFLKSFTCYVEGDEVYEKGKADALEAELQPLVGGMITKISKYDTNPANNPQPPARDRAASSGEGTRG